MSAKPNRHQPPAQLRADPTGAQSPQVVALRAGVVDLGPAYYPFGLPEPEIATWSLHVRAVVLIAGAAFSWVAVIALARFV